MTQNFWNVFLYSTSCIPYFNSSKAPLRLNINSNPENHYRSIVIDKPSLMLHKGIIYLSLTAWCKLLDNLLPDHIASAGFIKLRFQLGLNYFIVMMILCVTQTENCLKTDFSHLSNCFYDSLHVQGWKLIHCNSEWLKPHLCLTYAAACNLQNDLCDSKSLISLHGPNAFRHKPASLTYEPAGFSSD